MIKRLRAFIMARYAKTEFSEQANSPVPCEAQRITSYYECRSADTGEAVGATPEVAVSVSQFLPKPCLVAECAFDIPQLGVSVRIEKLSNGMTMLNVATDEAEHAVGIGFSRSGTRIEGFTCWPKSDLHLWAIG